MYEERRRVERDESFQKACARPDSTHNVAGITGPTVVYHNGHHVFAGVHSGGGAPRPRVRPTARVRAQGRDSYDV
ncbi:hypothetical protein GCM10022226_56890 [Sphaerisporangium flaviroseum]|uniref:Uncharacterized protein n=1 Tax=Sphaerisporangium flaviroseum TaxID=509199 RepID=A0ABP7IW93_9ACTN